jgi:hypothetical protein
MYEKCTRSSDSRRKTPPAGSGGAFRADGHSSVWCWMLLLSEPTRRMEASYSRPDSRWQFGAGGFERGDGGEFVEPMAMTPLVSCVDC